MLAYDVRYLMIGSAVNASEFMTDLQRTRLRQAFTDFLPLPVTLETHLKQALERVLENPGSLMRPEIVLEVASTYGLTDVIATKLAIALEYFHTSSLLFDDLPAMDDAVRRRGTPCVHVEFGDAAAILAALALVNRAYALMWQAVAASTPDRQARALQYVEHNLGVNGLLNGQSMDLHYASLPHDRTTTERTAIGKTVSLFCLTLGLPAMLGGASDLELQLLERIALFWGLSYQIVDDLKDILQTSTESGKTPSRDLSLGRPNIALVLGIGGAAERLQRLIRLGNQTLDRLVRLRPGLAFLRKLRDEAAELTENVCAPSAGGAG
jgi:geranylgeranyl diphosphate synthase type II